MALNKRIRFEVMRRDNHACRYCGAMAPDAKLTIDHVVPVALGGSDEPTNLVTACVDCNAGKSSTSPDASIVADVEQDAVRWARAMRAAADIVEEERSILDEQVRQVDAVWSTYTYGFQKVPVPRPPSWRSSIESFISAGLKPWQICDLIVVAMGAQHVAPDAVWRYFCGCCWKQVRRMQEMAHDLLVAEEADEWR